MSEVITERITPSEQTRCDECVRYAIWVLFGKTLAFSCDTHFLSIKKGLTLAERGHTVSVG